MKILELRFKNLNSLCGEWFIDFSHPEYSSNGLFAMTGPTGAGKSTILDAICLALYGATPRLGKLTKNDNELMSRQTAECYAEVLFEAQSDRFRCHWSQHRARKKADGDLQTPRHEISEGRDQGKVIEHQLRRVAIVIEQKTGMDFDRFTRSMLLAQGEFDTFLKADVEQKSKILEQITGTEIYTDISKKVHERQRDEREQLNLLLAETSGIAILEPEREKELQLNLEHGLKEESELALQAVEIEKSISWLSAIDGLRKEVSALSKDSENQQIMLESFKPERQRLNRAVRAAALDGEYATLKTERKQLVADQISLTTEQESLPILESALQFHMGTLETTEHHRLKAKEAMREAAPLIQRVRMLDQKLSDQKQAIESGEQACEKDEANIHAEQQRRIKIKDQANQAESRLKCAQQYLNAHSEDEWLVGGLAGIEEQLARLLSKQQDMTKKSNQEQLAIAALKLSCEKLAACTTALAMNQQCLEAAVNSHQQGKRILADLLADRLLREYRSEKEALLREMAFLNKIAELEDHRRKLEDHKACPLCGAKQHPFAEGNVPTANETELRIEQLSELIQKSEDQQALINKLEAAEYEAEKKRVDSERLEAAQANEKKSDEKTLADLRTYLSAERADFTKLKRNLWVKLKPLGIENITDLDISLLLESLRNRLIKWHAQVEASSAVERQLSELKSQLKSLDAVHDTLSSALIKSNKALNLLKNHHSDATSDRQSLYGDKKTDVEENRFNVAVADTELAEKQARCIHDEALQKFNTSTSHVHALELRIVSKSSELKKLESGFESSIQAVEFLDEKNFLEARLTLSERDELHVQATAMDNEQTGIKARLKDREQHLEIELARKLSDKSLAQLQPELEGFAVRLKQLRESITGLKLKLFENRAAKDSIKQKKAAIDGQQKECQRWEKLHGLIGSADGKKFRNFAQGLTFELMVSHANQQLEKMNDRYLLIRDDKAPLELNVVDQYQAGEIRSTKNLSGGESFIVSLTLALGLSKMASRKVRVDSLFLDEGFGTLDESTLETALEALTSLQQDGKLIGVISHVPALKERITTQIQVQPQYDGTSIIVGAGCKRL